MLEYSRQIITKYVASDLWPLFEEAEFKYFCLVGTMHFEFSFNLEQ